MANLVLEKLSLSEDNAGAGQLVDSKKVETEPGTLAVKGMDSEKAKAGSGTYPEKVIDSEKVNAGPETLTDAKAAEVSKTVVDLARVGPEMEGSWTRGTHGQGNKQKKK